MLCTILSGVVGLGLWVWGCGALVTIETVSINKQREKVRANLGTMVVGTDPPWALESHSIPTARLYSVT